MDCRSDIGYVWSCFFAVVGHEQWYDQAGHLREQRASLLLTFSGPERAALSSIPLKWHSIPLKWHCANCHFVTSKPSFVCVHNGVYHVISHLFYEITLIYIVYNSYFVISRSNSFCNVAWFVNCCSGVPFQRNWSLCLLSSSVYNIEPPSDMNVFRLSEFTALNVGCQIFNYFFPSSNANSSGMFSYLEIFYPCIHLYKIFFYFLF